jgi:hypothetical protein
VRADGRFCPHCGLEWAREPNLSHLPAPILPSSPAVPSTTGGSGWAAVGEYSVGQFHAARAVLGRYNIPCRAGPIAFDSPNMSLEVPASALVWATSLLFQRSDLKPQPLRPGR